MINVSEYYMEGAVREERIKVIKCMLEKEYGEIDKGIHGEE